ncbi:hypothetical protein [Xylanibacter rodentium]|uniref:hypothetical protein n=1 Tax=Xylanibacter rodentium TaxID=2736289 RepID=UPI002589F308|nr:hypothetical protein [Xylanibacter rodentium]
MDYKRLSCLMDAIILKAQEVKSESEKEHPEVWKVCDLAIEDLNCLFDEVGACVFSRCVNSVKTDLCTTQEDVRTLDNSVNAFSEDDNVGGVANNVNLQLS